jgi:Ca-activated chloride channel family protein
MGGQVAGHVVMPEAVAAPQYKAIEEHAVVQTADQAVTTFSIDVDRASYANVRRFLAAGQMPPPDAVRIEEMLNYFTYHYPQPVNDAPFSITTEVAGTPWNTGTRLLRIGIQGRNLEEWKAAPNNLVFLIDTSGSMQPINRLPLLKSAFRVLVDRLRAEDRVSLVAYAGSAGLVLPPTSGADKQRILEALDRLEGFASEHGPRFYGLDPNPDRIELVRGPSQVPDLIGSVVPFGAGESFGWQMAS